MGGFIYTILWLCDPSVPGCYDRAVAVMAVKIRVSYERPEELRWILDRLGSDVKSWKAARRQEGPYKKAYIEIRDQENR